MKVYFKNKEYEVSQVDRITPKIAESFADLAAKLKEDPNYRDYIQAMSDADLSYSDTNDKNELSKAKLSEIMKAEHAISKATYIKENRPIEIKICQLITKETSVPKTIRNEYYGDTDNEFWQEQGIVEVKKYINSFRKRLFALA